MANIENRAGIVPVETVKKYEINTSQVGEYLQTRINGFTSAARKNGIEMEDIPINVITMEFSKKFTPFIVILPEEAIAQRSGKDEKEGIMSIFQNEDNGELSKLEKPVWSAIASYLYTKNDKKCFTDSGNLRKTLGLTTGDANKIASYCSPKIIKVEKDRRHVVCLIDPIRVFSDMIRAENETTKDGAPKYMTMIEKSVKLSHGNFKYYITKEPKKRSGNGGAGPDIIRFVRESMSGRK